MKKIIFLYCLLGLSILISGVESGKAPAEVRLYYSGETGSLLQDLPFVPGTRFSLQKSSFQEINSLLKKGSLRLALCEELPANLPEGYEVQRLAVRGMILAVNPENPLRNITLRQAKDLLELAKGNWKQFGGPALRIHLYHKATLSLPSFKVKTSRRNAEEEKVLPSPRTIEEYRSFRARLNNKNRPLPPEKDLEKVLKLPTNSDEKTFSLLYTDRRGIGVFSLNRFDETRLKLLTVDQIPPTLDNFLAGSYPLLTTLYRITKKDLSPAEKVLCSHLSGKKFAIKLFRAGFLVFPPAKRKIIPLQNP